MLGRLDVDHGAVSRRLELHFQRLELKDRFMFYFCLTSLPLTSLELFVLNDNV